MIRIEVCLNGAEDEFSDAVGSLQAGVIHCIGRIGPISPVVGGKATLDMSEVIVTSQQNLRNEVRYGEGHTLITDEPGEIGGEDFGPDPYTLLLAALGSCISMTVTLYARRKNWPLEQVTVRLRQNRIHAKDCQKCAQNAEGYVHRIERAVSFKGNLTNEQRERLREISHKCPVHKTLSSQIVIAELVE